MLFVLSLHSSTSAQSELTLYQMPDVPKIMSINPALSPWANTFVGMPGISNINLSVGSDFATFAEFGLTVDFLQGEFDFDDEIDFEEVLLTKTTAKNQFISSNTIDLLSFGGRINKGFFAVAVTEHLDARLGFPRDLIQLFSDLGQEDPGGIVGQVYDLGNLSLIGSHHRTYNVSYSYDFSRDLTLGAKIGFVQGLGNALIKPQNYRVMATTNGFESMGTLTAHSAGLPFLYGDEEISVSDYLLASGNSGLVFGFGGQYRLSPKLDIAASVNNIGSIKWKNNAGAAVLTETFTEDQGGLGAYSEELFTIDSDTVAAYNTFLPAAFSAQANYYVLPFFSVSGLVYSRGTNGIRSTSASLAGNVRLLKVLNFTAAIHYVHQKVGLGLGGSLNLGPLQFYLASDNAINLLTGNDINRVQLTGGVFFTFNKLSHKENMARLDALYPAATDSTALLATNPTSESEAEVEARKERSFFAFGKKNRNETPDEDASEYGNLAASTKKDTDEVPAETAIEVSAAIPDNILTKTPLTTELMDTQADDLPDIAPIKERTTPTGSESTPIQTAPVPNAQGTPVPNDRIVFLELKQDANMYRSTTTSSTMIRRMFSGTKVKLQEQVNTDWWKVSWGSKTGYMRSEVLQLSGNQYQSIVTRMNAPNETTPQDELSNTEAVPEQAATNTQPLGSFFVTQRTSFRKAATHKSDVILRFRVGDKVELLEKTNQWWWNVRFDGNTGWVKAALLEQF